MSLIIIDAHTRWQILSCLIYLEKHEPINSISHAILLQGAPNSVVASNKNIQEFLEKRFENVKFIKRGALTTKDIPIMKNALIITSVNFPLEAFSLCVMKTKKIPRIIKVDEGLGSYASKWANIKLGASFYKNKTIGYCRLTSSFLLLSVLKKLFSVKNHHLLEEINEETKNLTLKIFRETGRGLKVDSTVKTIILEDPRCPWIGKHEQVIVKKHPHFSTMQNIPPSEIDDFTTEEIVANNTNIMNILGYNSSSLVYCNALFNTNTFNITPTPYPDKNIRKLIEKHSSQIKTNQVDQIINNQHIT